MRRAALLILGALALTGCGGGDESAGPQAQPADSANSNSTPAAVADLENVLRLRADFEADAGKTRVILLLSPT